MFVYVSVCVCRQMRVIPKCHFLETVPCLRLHSTKLWMGRELAGSGKRDYNTQKETVCKQARRGKEHMKKISLGGLPCPSTLLHQQENPANTVLWIIRRQSSTAIEFFLCWWCSGIGRWFRRRMAVDWWCKFVDGLLPDSFTNSTVIPLIKYKTGDLTDINNCRANYFV